jgi:hypothetical protein
MLNMVAHSLDTTVLDSLDLEQKIKTFLNAQMQLSLLDPNLSSFPLARKAVAQYEKNPN